MSTYKIVLFFCCFQLSLLAQEQNNVSLKFNSPSFQHKMYYLAGYYGKYTVLLDSVKATKEGKLLFKNNKKYTEGIYLLVDANKSIVTEFIMDEKQQFSIDVNVENTSKSTVRNSETNKLFFEFNALLKQNNQHIQQLAKQLTQATTEKDSTTIKNQINTLNNAIGTYKNNLIKKQPTHVLSLLFNLSKPIESYFNHVNLATKKESFFKGINFSDERLLRNPFLEKKINTYFKLLVPNTPEAITQEIVSILNRTGNKNETMFSYLSLFFVNNYVNATIMGNDRVFINIYNTFFKNKTYNWLTSEQQIFLNTSNLHIKDNLIGSKAKNLFMTTIDEQTLNLYDVTAPYIIVIFWDPSCGHCTKELPKINKWFTTNLKSNGAKIYAVNINPDLKKEWKAFIEKEKLNDWIHVYPSPVVYGNYSKEAVDFQTLYNVIQTPVIYLLDSAKIFRAKKISVEKYQFIINQLDSN